MRRLLLALALLLTIGAGCASAQVVFDAKGTADCTGNAIVGTTGKTCATLTVGSGSNRALVCQVGMSIAAPTSEVMTWDSGGTNQAMTQIVAAATTGTSHVRAELWGLVAPTSGAKTVKMTWVGTSDLTIDCVSWTGVDQTGGATTFPHSTSHNTSLNGNASLTVTSASGNAAMDAYASGATPSAPNQTQVFLDTTPASSSVGGQRAAGAASVSFTWTDNTNSGAIQVGTDILAAGGGGGCTAPPNQLAMMGVGNCKGH